MKKRKSIIQWTLTNAFEILLMCNFLIFIDQVNGFGLLSTYKMQIQTVTINGVLEFCYWKYKLVQNTWNDYFIFIRYRFQCQCHIHSFPKMIVRRVDLKSFFFNQIVCTNVKVCAELAIKWFMSHLFEESSHLSGRKRYENLPHEFAQKSLHVAMFFRAVYRFLRTMTMHCDVLFGTELLLLFLR